MPFTPFRTEALIKSWFFALTSFFLLVIISWDREKNKKVLFQLNGPHCSNLIIIINIYKCSVLIHIENINIITLIPINTNTNIGIDIIHIWIDTPTTSIRQQKVQEELKLAERCDAFFSPSQRHSQLSWRSLDAFQCKLRQHTAVVEIRLISQERDARSPSAYAYTSDESPWANLLEKHKFVCLGFFLFVVCFLNWEMIGLAASAFIHISVFPTLCCGSERLPCACLCALIAVCFLPFFPLSHWG